MSKFYLRIKELRSEKKISQKQLAIAINCGQSTICDWEKGKIEPSADALIAVANYFDVSIDYIVGRKDY